VTFNADYSYEVSGKRYDGSADITRATFLALRLGGPIALRYSASKPEMSEAGDISHSDTTLFLTRYLGFPVSLFILFLAFRKQPSVPDEDLAPTQDHSAELSAATLPNTVKGIAFTAYPVTDMKRARKFYEEDLGLRVSVDLRGAWIEYHLWDNCFAITSMLGDSAKPSSTSGGSIALEVQDVDDFVSQLRKKGAPVKVEPFSTRVCRMAVVLDPDGNALTLHAKT
jgi:predicted enzyme related to lactoylglutathione lyase